MRGSWLLGAAVLSLTLVGAAKAETAQQPTLLQRLFQPKAAQQTVTPQPAPVQAQIQQAKPDTSQQPRLRRPDDMVPVVVSPKPTYVPQYYQAAPKTPAVNAPATPATAAAPATPAALSAATQRDLADCLQADPARVFAGCSHLIDDAKQLEKIRAAAYYNRANAHAAQGNPEAAIEDYDAALKLMPNDVRALNNRGTTYRDSGDADRALADFEAAVKADPRNAEAQFNLGNAYAAKGENDKAIAAYTAALAVNAYNADVYVARGIAELYSGAMQKALYDLQLALRIAPRNAYAVLWNDIALRRAKRPSILAFYARYLDAKAWPAPVIKLWRGEMAADAVIAAAEDRNATTRQAQLCEANFYGGELALLNGTKDQAAKLLEAAAKDCPQPFLERVAASAELKALAAKAD